MSDDYQLRKDVDTLYQTVFNTQSQQLRLVTLDEFDEFKEEEFNSKENTGNKVIQINTSGVDYNNDYDHYPSVKAILDYIDAHDSSYDTGWVDITVPSDSLFKVTTSILSNGFKYRVKDDIVDIIGTVEPKSTISNTSNYMTIGSLPSEYAPTHCYEITTRLMVGSKSIALIIDNDGIIYLTNYTDGTTSSMSISGGTWIQIHTTFMI